MNPQVLLIEDDPAVASVVTRTLTEAGYGVVHVDVADKARALAPRADAVILDPNTGAPDIDLAYDLREAGYTGPILVYSAAGATLRERLMRRAINDGLGLSAWVIKGDEEAGILLGPLARALGAAEGSKAIRAKPLSLDMLRDIRRFVLGSNAA